MFFMVEPRRDRDAGRVRALSLALLLSLPLAAASARADEVSVEARRNGEALEVTCRSLLEAPLELIWQTLTDYGRLAEFIPGMSRSRVLSQNGPVSVIEQLGAARFLFISIPIEITLSSTERPPYAIDARLLKGNLKRLEGGYRIEPQAGGRMLLSWTGVIEAESMPPLIGEMLLRSNIEDQFRGMVREIERREELRRAREPAK
jgi:ribosome-associated toxin RatA of RatAB toxin-antitoxin module